MDPITESRLKVLKIDLEQIERQIIINNEDLSYVVQNQIEAVRKAEILSFRGKSLAQERFDKLKEIREFTGE